MRQVCDGIVGLFAIVVFFVGWVATGDFVGALSGSILLLLFLAAVFGAVFIVFDVVGSLAEGKCGLLCFVLVVLGVSWLLGGEDDDPDC